MQMLWHEAWRQSRRGENDVSCILLLNYLEITVDIFMTQYTFYFIRYRQNMIISHNLMAMNAQRQFNIVGNAKKKSMEKLSSGYRINRAADDAAGLAISEKMRRQIRGLTQGAYNIQDGISLVQVADGALNETQNILQRMNELAVKAANGTNSDEDRKYINQEVQQLKNEIDRIANNTSFNGEVYPLKYDETKYTIKDTFGSANGEINTLKIENAEQYPLYQGLTFTKDKYGFHYATDNNGNTMKIDFMGQFGWARNENNQSMTYEECYGHFTVQSTPPMYLGQLDMWLWSPAMDYYVKEGTSQDSFEKLLKGVKSITIDKNGIINIEGSMQSEREYISDSLTNTWIQSGSETGVGFNLHTVDATSYKLGISGIDISTIDGAEFAIDDIKDALAQVSTYRSYFGSMQNRMEHTYNSNMNVAENTQAAESRIRDTDMAKEMVANSVQNILEQAGISMISQANQTKQGVLTLL